MSTTFDLYRLQKIDSQIDKIQRHLNEILKILADNSEIKRAQAYFDQSQAAHQITEKTLRKAETEVKNQRIKIQQTESILYGGSVKNPKEVQDLQNKSESLKRYLSKLEDDQLEAMLAHDDKIEILEDAQRKLDKVKAKLIQENSQLRGEKSALDEKKERFLKERGVALPALQEQLIKLYTKLRKTKRGVAIASIKDGGCSACGVNLTLAVQQAARTTTKIAYCPSCRRIVYGN